MKSEINRYRIFYINILPTHFPWNPLGHFPYNTKCFFV